MIVSMRRVLLPILAVVLASAVLGGQEFIPAPGADPLHRPLDQILDVNVRDGLVYYRALKSGSRQARPLHRVAERAGGDVQASGRQGSRWRSG